ncbi:MAG: IS1/IS6 family transposase [Chloroflexi bacterium]|nr:IS1/IS6 family transposase [Chloroflexota bacterium]
MTIVCKFCGSTDVIRWGAKHGTQYYRCKTCGRKFAQNMALPGMRYSPDLIASALNQFYEGMSLNAIRRHLDHDYQLIPSDSTVYEWMVRFTKQAVAALGGLLVSYGDVIVVDETVLGIDGKNAWFWDAISDDSRYLVASHLSYERSMQQAVALMRRVEAIGTKPPRFVVSDGLRSYPDAVERVFGADTKHVVSRGFSHEVNTNLIERFHGTIKQRTKVMRGMQNIHTARLVMDGWLVHYNFFRPHESLDGATPGRMAKVAYPFTSWSEVVKHGYIPTEHRHTTRLPT